MKLLLVNDQGQPVACLEDLERYDVRSPAQVFALLDLLERLIEAAKQYDGEGGATGLLSRRASL